MSFETNNNRETGNRKPETDRRCVTMVGSNISVFNKPIMKAKTVKPILAAYHRSVSGIRYPGFSLVEIMIVIVIIGLLAGVVTINVRGNMTKAKQNIARQDIKMLVDTLEQYNAENGHYPTSDEGLAALYIKSTKTGEPYLTKEPVDPWGRSYAYVSPGPNGPFVVMCLGADGKPGGDGADTDISSDDVPQKATP